MNDCFMILNNSVSGIATVELPSYPEEISDSTSANWSDQSIIGRSSPISSYTGTGYRSVSFSFTLHRQMSNSFNSYNIETENPTIENILRLIRGSVYPEYNSAGITPTLTTFVFGSQRFYGIVRSVSFNWKKPIVNGKYQLVDVQVQMDDIPSSVVGTSNLGASYDPFKHTNN